MFKLFFDRIKSKLPKGTNTDLILAFVLLFVLLCVVSYFFTTEAKAAPIKKIEIDAGFAFEMGNPKTFGRNPAGDVTVKVYPFDRYLFFGYRHNSSVPDQNDNNVFDALIFGVRYCFGEYCR